MENEFLEPIRIGPHFSMRQVTSLWCEQLKIFWIGSATTRGRVRRNMVLRTGLD
jgi:hypothetical protein